MALDPEVAQEMEPEEKAAAEGVVGTAAEAALVVPEAVDTALGAPDREPTAPVAALAAQVPKGGMGLASLLPSFGTSTLWRRQADVVEEP